MLSKNKFIENSPYPEIFEVLHKLSIEYEYYTHPPLPTAEIAQNYWKYIDSTHCKNLFFRNHKGNKHYLVIFDYNENLNIKTLEQILKQGKLTFASEQRLLKYLNVQPGSVSPLGLVYDKQKHVKVFLDSNLKKSHKISFHPNICTATVVMLFNDFIKFLDYVGNEYEFINLVKNAE